MLAQAVTAAEEWQEQTRKAIVKRNSSIGLGRALQALRASLDHAAKQLEVCAEVCL